jgi:HSP20 family protein
MSGLSSGLSVSEDDKYVYVEAAVPGVDPEKIEVSYDKGVLWIRGQQEEQDKKRKFYRKASTSFSYRLVVPGNIDESKDPEATYKNGIMKVTFNKVPEPQPKKIAVRVQ